jgi:hypothetical protein
MSVLGVEFSSEPNYDRFVHSTASDHGKKVPIVPIHQCDSNHRSQNHEEKRETEDRYENVRQAEPPRKRGHTKTKSCSFAKAEWQGKHVLCCASSTGLLFDESSESPTER